MASAAATRITRRRLLDFFAFEPGEVRPTLLLTLYLLLAIASVVALKAASKALYLHRFEARTLPYAYLATALVVGFIVSFYIKLSVRLPQNLLLIYTQLFFAANLVLFWWLLHLRFDWLPAVILVWTGIFTVILVTQVWTLANHILTTRQARRLFPFIGAGGILGAAVGGQVSRQVIRLIGTQNVLVAYIPFLLVCSVIVAYVWRTTRHLAPAPKGKQPSPSTLAESWQLIRGSNYLSLMAVLVVVSAIVNLLVEYQFNFIVQGAFSRVVDGVTRTDREGMGAFFSEFDSYLAIFSFLMHMILTSRVMRWFGLNFAIFVLPISMLLGSTVLLLSSGLIAGILIKGFDRAFRHSIDRSSTELLYVPLPTRVRQQAKSFIDIIASRWADGVGAVLLLVLASVLHFSLRQISFVNLSLIVPWLLVAWMLRREYVNTLRSSIERKDISAEALLVEMAGSTQSEEITATLTSSDERAVETGLGLLQYGQANVANVHLGALLTHMSPIIRRKAMSIVAAKSVPDLAPQVSVFLFLENDVESLRVALDYLEQEDPHETFVHFNDLLEAPHAILRGTVAAWLLSRPGSPHRAKAVEVLTAFVDSARAQQPAYREAAAELLGLVPAELECQSALADFLADSNPQVVRAAARATGRTRQQHLLPRLVELAGDRVLKTEARRALAAFGPDILPALNEFLLDPRVPIKIRRNLPRVFSNIGGQEAADCLALSLDQKDVGLQYQVLRALGRIRLRQPGVRVESGRVTPLTESELRRYYRYVSILHAVPQDGPYPGRAFLHRALAETLDRKLEIIFRLIGLLYPPKDIFDAYYGISSGRRDLRANALEFLDSLLLNPLRQWLMPAIENRSTERILEHARSIFGIERRSYPEALRDLLADSDSWLQACATYAAADQGLREVEPLLELLRNTEDPLLEETVRVAQERLHRSPGVPGAPEKSRPSPGALWKL